MKSTVSLCHVLSLNHVYPGKYFTVDPPARVAYAAKALPLNARVEIDAIAISD